MEGREERVMRELIQGIKQKELEVKGMQDVALRLPAAVSDLAAMKKTLRILQGKNGEDKSSGGAMNNLPILKHSSMAIAMAILTKVEKPLHIDDLVREFEVMGKTVKKGSLVSSITKNVKSSNPTFTKTGKNTFGLVKMGAG